MGSGPGMRLQVVHLRKNYGVKNPSELHIPSENIVGGYLFTCVVVLWGLERFSFHLYMASIISHTYTRLVVASKGAGNSPCILSLW